MESEENKTDSLVRNADKRNEISVKYQEIKMPIYQAPLYHPIPSAPVINVPQYRAPISSYSQISAIPNNQSQDPSTNSQPSYASLLDPIRGQTPNQHIIQPQNASHYPTQPTFTLNSYPTLDLPIQIPKLSHLSSNNVNQKFTSNIQPQLYPGL